MFIAENFLLITTPAHIEKKIEAIIFILLLKHYYFIAFFDVYRLSILLKCQYQKTWCHIKYDILA